MPSAPTPAPTVESSRTSFLILVGALFAVLSILFFQAYLPGFVIFSNDGPLGAVAAAMSRLPDAYTGMWLDLNWVGNDGVAVSPTVSSLIPWLLGPVLSAKLFCPALLFLLGVCAWVFFRQCGFHPWVCVVGGVAAALNGNRFSVACWGLSVWALSMGAIFLALAASLAGRRQRPWIFSALAGLATGMAVMEGFDTGAIFSLVVAGFAVVLAYGDGQGAVVPRLAQGATRVAVIAAFAAFISAHTLVSLVSTQVKGVVGMSQDAASRQARWEGATMWSLPKVETLRVVIPGLFGYRMDTPDGGAYWGTIGRSPGWEQHKQGTPRHSGSGEYAGVLVVLVAGWALVQALRRKDGGYSDTNRRLIWFWAAVGVVSLLLAFGKHAPFYQFFYALPYASTIRNPVKFMHTFHLVLLILFGYGLQNLAQTYLSAARPASTRALGEHVKNWWETVRGFERRWTVATGLLVVASVFGWMLFGSARRNLEAHLQAGAFDADTAGRIAAFSIGEVGWFIFFLTFSAVLVMTLLSGFWQGRRARWGFVAVLLLLVVDLGRANAPWVISWDYKFKYASNPIIEKLREAPHEHRVQALPFPINQPFNLFQQVYGLEWTQHLFPYNNIQSLDITQEPRPTADNMAYRTALLGRATTLTRLWELTNTRYLFGVNSPDLLRALSRDLDQGRERFRIVEAFDLVPKAGVGRPTRPEQLTAETTNNGALALIEFTGALPRARLYANWLVTTNDTETLGTLTNITFNPRDLVLVSQPIAAPAWATATNAAPGDVKIVSYAPRRVRLEANVAVASVLLLNDKFSSSWKVFVEGQPETLLRCNFLMRGVALKPGRQEIEFRHEPPAGGLRLSLAGIVVGLALLGFVLIRPARRDGDATTPSVNPAG